MLTPHRFAWRHEARDGVAAVRCLDFDSIILVVCAYWHRISLANQVAQDGSLAAVLCVCIGLIRHQNTLKRQ